MLIKEPIEINFYFYWFQWTIDSYESIYFVKVIHSLKTHTHTLITAIISLFYFKIRKEITFKCFN